MDSTQQSRVQSQFRQSSLPRGAMGLRVLAVSGSIILLCWLVTGASRPNGEVLKDYTLALVGSFRVNGEPRTVEVFLSPCQMMPGKSWARVDLDRVLYEFQTGDQLDCDAASVVAYPGRPLADLLRISCHDARLKGLGRGTPDQIQLYFGLTRDMRLALVRVTTVDASIPGLQSRIGSVPPYVSEAEWHAALQSPEPVEVLEALYWLGRARRSGAESDSAAYNKAHAAAQSSSRVLQAIEHLTHDQDQWIAQSSRCAHAVLSLNPTDANDDPTPRPPTPDSGSGSGR